ARLQLERLFGKDPGRDGDRGQDRRGTHPGRERLAHVPEGRLPEVQRQGSHHSRGAGGGGQGAERQGHDRRRPARLWHRGAPQAARGHLAAYLHARGSTWLGPNREPMFNNEDGVKALDLYGRLLRQYGPPGSENNHWYEASSIFSQGKSAMYTDSNALFPVIEDPQKSKVIGKVGYALFPRGPKGQYGSTVAVWGLAMPKTSQNQKAAWLFMQWATAKEQVLAVQSEKGVLGARDSVWKDPKGLT